MFLVPKLKLSDCYIGVNFSNLPGGNMITDKNFV